MIRIINFDDYQNKKIKKLKVNKIKFIRNKKRNDKITPCNFSQLLYHSTTFN